MNAPECVVAKFLRLVKEMRDNQRSYFATRDRNVLRDCKVAERRVDELVAKLAPFYPTAVPVPQMVQPALL